MRFSCYFEVWPGIRDRTVRVVSQDFLGSFVGLAVTLFPFIVPGALTIYGAAANTRALVFMLSMVSFHSDHDRLQRLSVPGIVQ